MITIVKVNKSNKVTEVHRSFPITAKVTVDIKGTRPKERLEPLAELVQGTEESVEDFVFRSQAAIQQFLKQPRVEEFTEPTEIDEIVEGRIIAAWLANGETEQFEKRDWRVVRQDEQPEFDKRNSTLELVQIAVGDTYRETEAWNVVPFTAEQLASRISTECRDRIFAEADANTQMNMTAAKASGTLDADDEVQYLACLKWVEDMRAKATELATAGEMNYFEDEHWPTVTPEMQAFAAKY